MAGQKQVCDIRAGKRMTVAQSNEHLRVGNSSAWNANRAGTLDPTRTHLNFEIGKGGIVKEVDQKASISKRIKAILDSHGIKDPNENYSDEDLKKPRVGVRTHANIILEGSRETMRRLAFGEQQVDYERGSDNSHITRSPEIEKWAKDMYHFFSRKYGEENIAAFVVHLDESLPHIHCTIVPINESRRLSWVDVFAGKDKYEYSQRVKKLHDELAEVNEKWGLERGESVAKTGAQHKSYLQWLKEQIIGNQNTIEEQGETITRQAAVIDDQKQQLYDINTQIKQAERKLKGLTTMLHNLEQQREALEIDIAALEEERDNGNQEAAKKLAELNEQLNQLNQKIVDRNEQISDAKEQLRQLSIRKHSLQNEYDDLVRQKNKELPDILEKTQREANDTCWELAAEEMKKDYSAFEEFANELPANLRARFEELLEGSFFEDVAQRGEEIAAIGAALFLGYIDAATRIAQSGGGGGGNTGGWGRKKDEDDDTYMRRCCIMGRMMMRPAGKKRILRR